MSAPLPVLLARLANILESARLALEHGHHDAALGHLARAQELLEQVRG